MSLLSQYLISLRIRRNLTEHSLSDKAGLELDLYRQIESEPHAAPVDLLYRIFEALSITAEEAEEFSHLAQRVLRSSAE